MLETNKHPGSVCNIVGGGGVTTDEKGVSSKSVQNTIVSSKALVLVNCLNTFVHECSYGKYRQYKYIRKDNVLLDLI